MGPEIATFYENGQGPDFHIKPADAHSLLLPETVESLFVLYRLTKVIIRHGTGARSEGTIERALTATRDREIDIPTNRQTDTRTDRPGRQTDVQRVYERGRCSFCRTLRNPLPNLHCLSRSPLWPWVRRTRSTRIGGGPSSKPSSSTHACPRVVTCPSTT